MTEKTTALREQAAMILDGVCALIDRTAQDSAFTADAAREACIQLIGSFLLESAAAFPARLTDSDEGKAMGSAESSSLVAASDPLREALTRLREKETARLSAAYRLPYNEKGAALSSAYLSALDDVEAALLRSVEPIPDKKNDELTRVDTMGSSADSRTASELGR